MSALAFLAPLLGLMGVFVFYPLANSVRLTFYAYDFIKDTSEFVGLQNYADWATDPDMWHGTWVSVQFFFSYVLTSMVLGFIVAYFIDRIASKRFATLYRTIFYFPVVLPAAIVFDMWVHLYDPEYGLVSALGDGAGLERLNVLGTQGLALGGLSAMSVWRFLGETVVLMLVGLANIPREVSEAARVDGAKERQIVRWITLPMLAPMLFLIFVLRLKVLELTVEPLFMTEGGPVDSTMTYGLKAYYVFHRDDQVGYASTWYVMLAVVSLLIAVVVGKRMRAMGLQK